jgi:hypothetical protein
MYEQPAAADLSQGDIIEGCPILVWKLASPQHFGTTYTRIALPEPYSTQP